MREMGEKHRSGTKSAGAALGYGSHVAEPGRSHPEKGRRGGKDYPLERVADGPGDLIRTSWMVESVPVPSSFTGWSVRINKTASRMISASWCYAPISNLAGLWAAVVRPGSVPAHLVERID
jgi:hypothetical protein